MLEKKSEKTTLGIKPGKVFISIIGVLGSIITITLFIIFLNITQMIISTLVLGLIFSITYLIIIFLRLKGMKNEYNELIIDYNKLVDVQEFANDNRHTLENMVDEKNDELEILKVDNQQKDSIIHILWFFYPDRSEKVPERKELQNAMKIKQNQVIDDEKNGI